MFSKHTQPRLIRRSVLVGLALAASLTIIGSGKALDTAGSVPKGHRLIGKWYNGLPNGQYLRFQFTDVGAYAYSSPVRSTSGTFAIEDDQLTLRASGGASTRYTFRFECIGTGSFSEYLTLAGQRDSSRRPTRVILRIRGGAASESLAVLRLQTHLGVR